MHHCRMQAHEPTRLLDARARARVCLLLNEDHLAPEGDLNQMKRIASTVLTTALAFGGLLGFQSSALATACPATCGMQKRTCVRVARVTKLACKQDCRAGVDPTARGTCMRSCSSDYRVAKGGCRSEHTSCRETCTPPAGRDGCVGDCARDLARCVKGVSTDARSCLADCRAGTDPRGCGAECATPLQAGSAACRSDFVACKAACGGSPSGAFLLD